MQKQMPDVIDDLIGALYKCRCKKDLHEAKRLHAYLRHHQLESHTVLGNHLVPMLANCGSLPEAQRVFDTLAHPNEYSWTSLISSHIDSGEPGRAFQLYQRMQDEGSVQPNRVTYLALLNACTVVRDGERGKGIHAELVARGLERNVFTGSALLGNTLVDMYGKCGLLAEAQQTFSMLPVRNAVSWNAMISAYAEYGLHECLTSCLRDMESEGISPTSITLVCSLRACCTTAALSTGQEMHTQTHKRGLEGNLYLGSALVDMYTKCGLLADAQRVFDRLPVRDAVSWNTLITGYSENGLDIEVLRCFKKMQLEDVSADDVTYVLCLKACGTVGALQTGRDIHAEIRKSGLHISLYMGNSLVDMYGRCGSVAEALEVFDKLPFRDLVSWNAMLKAYGENHEANMVLQCFKCMQEHGVQPDAVTFTCILAACGHASLVVEGQEYFKMMKEEHKIEPTEDHYSCMVDLFARSGYVYEAEKYLLAIQCPPCRVILMALLSACKIYQKLDLGERCFQQLVEINEDHAGAYLLMVEIYARNGRWSDAIKLEEMRKYAGASRKPGSALIEVSSKMHEFVVGVEQSKTVVEMLEILVSNMKDDGYVPSSELRYRCGS